jgi:hypothetical protein
MLLLAVVAIAPAVSIIAGLLLMIPDFQMIDIGRHLLPCLHRMTFRANLFREDKAALRVTKFSCTDDTCDREQN